ncbi:hypothetical protein LTR95_006269, partial [Oleoguttula sp. CCFEE 5521]
AHTLPSSSARSSSIDDDSWIDHFIDDGLAHLAITRMPSLPRRRDTRASAPVPDVEAQQVGVTQPEVTIRLHPLIAAPSGMASEVDYEAGLKFTREGKKAMIIVFLAVLSFTITIIVAMVASGQQGKDGEWLSDHGRISLISDSSLGTAFPSSTTTSTHSADTAPLSDTQDSISLLGTAAPKSTMDTVPSTTFQQPTLTVETDPATVRMPARSSLDTAWTTPINLDMTTSTDSAIAITSMGSTPSTETSIETTTTVPQPIAEVSTDSKPRTIAHDTAVPMPGPAPDRSSLPVTSTTSTSLSSDLMVDSTPVLHSEVATSLLNVRAGWDGSLVMSAWKTPPKTVESPLGVVPTASPTSTAAVPTTTAVPTLETTPQNAGPDRRPGEVVNSILHLIGEGLEQVGHH